jgi:hypothetical protein
MRKAVFQPKILQARASSEEVNIQRHKYTTMELNRVVAASITNTELNMGRVTERENDILIQPFSEEEIKSAIFQMEHNKVPGLDDFPAEFYKSFGSL